MYIYIYFGGGKGVYEHCCSIYCIVFTIVSVLVVVGSVLFVDDGVLFLSPR